ncbi:MAG: polysaccharide biosynthesis/export family protein, partial [Gemmataceae bacterium]|nr:polysaccharide biosynthesis/export family protein [Gemmataceae bacterium]
PALAFLTAGGGAVGVSEAQVTAAARLAADFLQGNAVATGATALANGALTTMWHTKLTKLAAGLVLACVLGGTVAWGFGGGQENPNRDPAQPPAKTPTQPDTPAKKTPTDPTKAPDPKAKDTGRPAEERIKPGDRLKIQLTGGGFPDDPVPEGPYEVEASGKIALPLSYGGRMTVGGLTLEEAEAAVREQLKNGPPKLKNPLVQITRYTPPDGRLTERRLDLLEREVDLLRQQVKQLQAEVETLRNKKQQ